MWTVNDIQYNAKHQLYIFSVISVSRNNLQYLAMHPAPEGHQ